MSDTMNASGAQALEPRPRMSDPAPGMSALAGKFSKQQSQCVLDWATVRIWTDIADELRLEASADSNGLSFLGSSTLNVDPLHPPAKFASHADPDNEFVYASLCDGMLTLTYIQYKKGTQEPAATGVWLGTSSGGQVYRPVKA